MKVIPETKFITITVSIPLLVSYLSPKVSSTQ